MYVCACTEWSQLSLHSLVKKMCMHAYMNTQCIRSAWWAASPLSPQPPWWCSVPCVSSQPPDGSHSGTGCGQAVRNGLQGPPHHRPPEIKQTCWHCVWVLLDLPACANHLEKVCNFCEEVGRHYTRYLSWQNLIQTVYFNYREFDRTIHFWLYICTHTIHIIFCLTVYVRIYLNVTMQHAMHTVAACIRTFYSSFNPQSLCFHMTVHLTLHLLTHWMHLSRVLSRLLRQSRGQCMSAWSGIRYVHNINIVLLLLAALCFHTLWLEWTSHISLYSHVCIN